ncbi:MAG: STAS domain-containing protein [Gemmatimonadetes bacterium]|nr:MAG: STAS domain-containing protein [Gemmatimonadota bacterium]
MPPVWTVIDQLELADVTVEVLVSPNVEEVTLIRFQGELFTEHVQTVFESIASPSGKWIRSQEKGKTVILDLYELDYVNSLTIGYLANIYNVLYSRQVKLKLIIAPDKLIHQILEQVGFLQFPGITFEFERTYI